MKRLDMSQSDKGLVAELGPLTDGFPGRQAKAVVLLVRFSRWTALLHFLKRAKPLVDREAFVALLLPVGLEPVLYEASRDSAASAQTLDALKALAWVRSDAQAKALARKLSAWELEAGPVTPASLQHWLNAGLRTAVAGDDIDKLRWWMAQGADVLAEDVDGRNAVQAASSLPMLQCLLAQGAPTDGKRYWDGRAVDLMARRGQWALLQCMTVHGADLSSLGWSPLHRLVALGSDAEVEAALSDPQLADLLTQLDALDSWRRTPIMLAALQGSAAKLNALQQAGAQVQVRWRDYPLGYWVLESRRPEAMRWWLGQDGVQVDEAMGGLGNTLLLDAVERNDLAMAALLLANGADPNRYNSNNSCPLKAATTRAMLELLIAHGGDMQWMGREGARVWLDLPPIDSRASEWLVLCTQAEFDEQRAPRMGQSNGEPVTSAFHLAMIESCESAFGAANDFGLEGRAFTESAWSHVWNVDRFGQSLTVLPDGRCIQIGGEHEDGYDPDFYIYNDVIVHTPPTADSADKRWDRQVFAYPLELFPSTDFHSATLIGDEIIVIGCLGYPAQRKAGFTPVYALHIHSLQMREIVCTGDMPGWIYRHGAKRVGLHTIEVWRGQDGKRQLAFSDEHDDISGVWQLDLAECRWTKLADGPASIPSKVSEA